jgi:hypothetical protein
MIVSPASISSWQFEHTRMHLSSSVHSDFQLRVWLPAIENLFVAGLRW